MKNKRTIFLSALSTIIFAMIFIISCKKVATEPKSTCGNGVCDLGESNATCPGDCPTASNATNFTASVNGTYYGANANGTYFTNPNNNCLVAGGQFTKAGGISAASIAKMCSTTTDILSVNEQNNFTIFPNPFNSSVTIQFNLPMNGSELNIYNAFGQKVKTINHISGDKIKIDRDKLSSGIYFIRLAHENKIITTGKLIIAD